MLGIGRSIISRAQNNPLYIRPRRERERTVKEIRKLEKEKRLVREEIKDVGKRD